MFPLLRAEIKKKWTPVSLAWALFHLELLRSNLDVSRAGVIAGYNLTSVTLAIDVRVALELQNSKMKSVLVYSETEAKE